jgi:nucleoside-diphosphate-sugar epimerase
MTGIVAVTGAAGRLGSAIVRRLAGQGLRVRALDVIEGVYPVEVESRFLDLTDQRSLRSALEDVDVLAHVAGLHGAHLVAGVPRREVWRVNVDGTWRLLRAARHVRRVVFASSTSVYGPGTRRGPARVLDEDTPLAPADVYDLTKVLGERMLDHVRRAGQETVALRLGRFYYGSRWDYHLRKLSTGLDLYDAVSAFVRCALTDASLRPAYCVVSDLELAAEQRARLGTELPAVLEEALPGFAGKLHRLGFPVPARFGKSATAAALRADTGWRPVRDLRWWSGELDAELLARPAAVGA